MWYPKYFDKKVLNRVARMKRSVLTSISDLINMEISYAITVTYYISSNDKLQFKIYLKGIEMKNFICYSMSEVSKLWSTYQICPIVNFKNIVYSNTDNTIYLPVAYGCLILPQQSWAAVTETVWPTKPKAFIIWLFT